MATARCQIDLGKTLPEFSILADHDVTNQPLDLGSSGLTS
jgi:hypothetical protein